VLRVNLHSAELDMNLDEAGFRHHGTGLRHRLGTARLGAGLYVADPGVPIWPYHYHHGDEEWLLVLSGAPVLREPAGRRTLAAADLVCFPSGQAGAHTLEGPGRFVLFSTVHPSRRTSVYPDSDKVGDVDGPGLLLRTPQAGYWYREGTAALDREPFAVPPLAITGPPRPVVNLNAEPVDIPSEPDAVRDGFRARSARLGSRLGGERAGATLYELDPGERSAPYHYEWGREEWLVVLAGAPTLRHPDGEDVLDPGDLVSFPEGPAGAHQLINRADTTVRVVVFSTKDLPAPVYYIDSDKWFIRNPDPQDSPMVRADEVDYWDREP
jgi:uncharacterized cupin superfamily protein